MCVCAEISYCLYMPCDKMCAHENLLNQMFWICTTPTIAADPYTKISFMAAIKMVTDAINRYFSTEFYLTITKTVIN